jgi:hypothetical protein
MPGPRFPFGGSRFGTEVRSDVRVALSGGQFMRNTSMIGTAQPGVEISIDYRVESGQLAPGEHYVLVIKSRTGRGELDNLHEVEFRPSGTINASSFMASPEQGPYEAWMEVASGHGPMGRRKQVSNQISLQFTNVAVRDLGQEARDAANQQQRMMEEQRRQMMNSLPGPMGPRFGGGMR